MCLSFFNSFFSDFRTNVSNCFKFLVLWFPTVMESTLNLCTILSNYPSQKPMKKGEKCLPVFPHWGELDISLVLLNEMALRQCCYYFREHADFLHVLICVDINKSKFFLFGFLFCSVWFFLRGLSAASPHSSPLNPLVKQKTLWWRCT